MMERGWRLGPYWYVPAAQLAQPEGVPGCSWSVVRRDGEGPRRLLQVWDPVPPGRLLDTLKAEFLQRFTHAEAMDPGPCHMGFDADKVWLLQDLGGVPLLRLWEQADRSGRERLLARVQEALAGSWVPRLLLPEVIGFAPGRMLVPRVLGAPPWAATALPALLEATGLPPGAGEAVPVWEDPPDLADGSGLPIRGRSRELTYLKSVMFGLGTATPMDRVLLLQGEEGLGHDRLCDWAAAAAETEGLWVSSLDLYPDEGPGALLERLLADLISGSEAELYAAQPAVARALAGRMATFAFLRGERRSDFATRQIEPDEVAAALAALAFAQARHPRLVLVRSLEQAGAGVARLLQDLVLNSRIPWVLSARDPDGSAELGACLASLRRSRATATVILHRLEDAHLAAALEDILGPHDLPEPFRAELCAASLGNPGLLRKILELAQVKGSLVRSEGRWRCAPGAVPAVEVRDDLVTGILQGRLLRLHPLALATVRYLALADEPLGTAILARVLGVDADALEEALQAAANAKLALLADGFARVAGPTARELAIAQMPAGEVLRCARSLLRVLGEKGGKPLLAVRLQAFALDRGTALAQVLQAVEQEPAGPLEAQRVVGEALKLAPDRVQQSSLWEFLADAWGRATEGDGLSMEGCGDRSPRESALAALDQAIQALGACSGWKEEAGLARLRRKKACLELQLRRWAGARESLRGAAELLADHPYHPEQPRLRLVQARLHFEQGGRAMALEALEEGLALLGQKGEEAGHRDQVALLLELGRVQGEGGQFQGALATLESLRRLVEHAGDRQILVATLDALGQVRLGMGQVDQAEQCLKEAIGLAKSPDAVAAMAECQLHLGVFRSCQQLLGPALASLESALRRFDLLGDTAKATQAQAWKARNLAALGDFGLSELLLMRAASAEIGTLSALERAERVFLDAEIAGFREAWPEARRHYLAAANRFDHAGLGWRGQLARLRCIQAEAQDAAWAGGADLKPAWIRLEQLKGPVEGANSRWLDLEWHRAHALLLACAGSAGSVAAQTVMAWGEVLSGARELKFPALALEASARSAALLLELGEQWGARSRIQDALPSLQDLRSNLPDGFEDPFLLRQDIARFLRAAADVGMPIVGAEAGARPNWNTTRTDLPLPPPVRAES